jgi:hypothetical protein
MSLAEVMEELPRLSFEERQLLIRRAIELDDPPLSETDEAVIDERLAGHHQDPSSPISLEALKVRIREQFVQNWLGTQFDKQPLAKLENRP